MIDIDTIEAEIMNLEKKDTSYAVIERLAWLYICKDHLQAPKTEEMTGSLAGNEFAHCCSNVPMQSLMSILSEHFDGIRLLYPKEYEQMLDRINSLK